MNQLLGLGWMSLGDYWKELDPKKSKTGEGYNRSANLEQKPAEFLGKLLDFVPPDGFYIDFDKLITYQERYGVSSAHKPRTERLYQAPLVIVRQSPGDDLGSARAYISERPIAFSKSYYGYSCGVHQDSETLAALIYLLVHSKLFAYFCLMISRRSGFDRQTFNKDELDAIPFPDIDTFPGILRREIYILAKELQDGPNKPWSEIDELVFRLYYMGIDEVQTATDTLFTAVSYRRAGRTALEAVDRSSRDVFVNALREELEPYFDVCGDHCRIEDARFQPDVWRESWYFLAISRGESSVPADPGLLAEAMDLANQRGSSLIMVRAPGNNGLLLGLLNRKRWWTITRARLCAQHIIRDHIDAFGLMRE